MDKNLFASIEFGYIYSKAIILSYHHNKFDVVATSIVKTMGFEDGNIVDVDGFYQTIAKLKQEIFDNFKIKLDEAILVLPNNYHKVDQASIPNKIVTARQIIGQNEIDEIRAKIVSSFSVDNEVLVEEQPTAFALDNNRVLRNPPINQQSGWLTITSNVHSTNESYLNGFIEAFKDNDIEYLGCVLNSLAATYLPCNDYSLEGEVIQVNILDDITTISAFKNNAMYDSFKINVGLKDLLVCVKDNFSLSEDDALSLIESYLVCDLSLCSSIIFDNDRNLSEKKISVLCMNKLHQMYQEIAKSINDLSNKARFVSPIVLLTGVLNDYEGFINDFASNCRFPVKYVDINIIGIHGNEFLNCYGAIYNYISFNPSKVAKRLNSSEHLDISSSSDEVFVSANKQEENNLNDSRKFKDIFIDD